MEVEMRGIIVLTLETDRDSKKVSLQKTKIALDIPEELDRSAYFDKDDMPTQVGSHTMTTIFIQGLIGNIHASHQKGFRDSAEHLRYIISELERGFVQVGELKEGEL